jgi:multicomponent Na+:H+ antiporter subunit B
VTQLIDSTLLMICLLTAIAIVRLRNLFGAVILMGIYSLVMAMIWTAMQALDVAFTEAAVGAGISTILMIGALVHTGSKEKVPDAPSRGPHWPSFATVVLTGALLIYGTFDMPSLGDPKARVHQGVAAYYKSEVSRDRTHAPNTVTAVLASYRGFDTMFETAVIFVAGAGMILLLRREETEAVAPDRDGIAGAPPVAPEGEAVAR